MAKKIHQQLKERAKALDKSKYRIAKETEHSEGMIKKILDGDTDPRLSTLQNIAESLEGTIEFIPNNKPTKHKK